jgi:succinate dehydrogenase / fumarate reductase membrane anchor subunit
MAFLTDRKRASGLGAAKTGTEHFWGMTISSAALLILVPLFVFTVGPMIGQDYETVTAYFRPPVSRIGGTFDLCCRIATFQKRCDRSD